MRANGYCFRPECDKEVPKDRANKFYCSDKCIEWAWKEYHPGQTEPDWSQMSNGALKPPPAARVY